MILNYKSFTTTPQLFKHQVYKYNIATCTHSYNHIFTNFTKFTKCI